jgi:DNA-binding NarL/FixJ family response regulator
VTRQPDAPRHVVATPADADTVLRRLRRDGWAVRDGFALPDPAWDVTGAKLVLHGRITDPDTLQLAVLAAARGAGIVATCDIESPLGRALLDDLGRLGSVRQGPGPDPAEDGADAVADLVPEQRALLDRLAAGDTIAAAAAAEFLSLRTANRRIAEARALFGVRTTREAVLAYLRQRKPR